MTVASPRVFISYSSKDGHIVDPLVRQLQEAGLDLWFDTEEIGPGDSIPIALVNALETTTLMVPFFSPSYLESNWGQFELASKVFEDPPGRHSRLIPVVIQPCQLPKAYAQLSRLDFTLKEQPATVEDLIWAISTRLQPLSRQSISKESVEPDAVDQIKTRSCDHPFDIRDGRAMVSLGPWSSERHCVAECPFCYVTSDFLPYPNMPVERILSWLDCESPNFDIVYISGDTDSFTGRRSEDAFRLMEGIAELNKDVMFTTRWQFSEQHLDRLASIAQDFHRRGRYVFGCVSIAQWTKPELEPKVASAKDRAEQVRRFREIGLVSVLALRPFIPTVPISDYIEILEACGHSAHVVLGEHWYADKGGVLEGKVRALEPEDEAGLLPERVTISLERMPFDDNEALWRIYRDPAKEENIRLWCNDNDILFFMRSRPAVEAVRARVPVQSLRTNSEQSGQSNFQNIIVQYFELIDAYRTKFGPPTLADSDKNQASMDGILRGTSTENSRSSRAKRAVEGLSNWDSNKRRAWTDSGGQNVNATPAGIRELEYFKSNLLSRLSADPVGMVEQDYTARLRRWLKTAEFQDLLNLSRSIGEGMDMLWDWFALTFTPDRAQLVRRDEFRAQSLALCEYLAQLFEERRSNRAALYRQGIREDRAAEAFRKLNAEVWATYPKTYAPLQAAVKLIENLKYSSLVPQETVKAMERRVKRVHGRLEADLLHGLSGHYEPTSEDDLRLQWQRSVVFGLQVGFTIWYLTAPGEEELRSLRKCALFCMRELLYKEEWKACRRLGDAVLPIVHVIGLDLAGDKHNGSYMIEANYFFAKLRIGELSLDELNRWNVEVSGVSQRYSLLKEVMRIELTGESGERAAAIAETLLTGRSEDGRPILSAAEFREWPILREFASGKFGQEVLSNLK